MIMSYVYFTRKGAIMSYNVFLWGFDSITVRNAMVKLEQDGIIKIQKWFIADGFKKQDFFARRDEAETSWYYQFNPKGNIFNIDKLEYPPSYIYQYMYNNMNMILHNLMRYTDAFRIPMHECLNILDQLINSYYTLLLEKRPDIIIFANVPHFADAIVLYFLAEAMKIKTLFFSPTTFEKKFCYCFSLSDYGKFHDVPEFDEKAKIVLEEKYEKFIPYTTDEAIKHYLGLNKSWNTKLRAFFSPYTWIKEKVKLVRDTFDKYENMDEFLAIKLIELVDKHSLERNYHRRSKALFLNNCDFSKPYVYFPLHFQPEMATDVLGGIYTDQLIALEQVRRIIPEDWKIYVKENPIQKSYKRGKEFFKRLTKIPNTVLLDRKVDTYKLIASSKFVATVNGTASWEAISGGKPTLIFGHQWFEELPGVFRYRDDITAQEIADFHIDHALLEAKVSELMKKMVTLVLHDEMLFNFYHLDFDQAENERTIYQFFRFILPHVKCHS